MTIAVVDGTENTLTDSEANDPDNAADNKNAEKAVVKCKDGSQVVLCGGGALTVNALGKNGIKSGTALDDRDASLTIRELTLNIEALVNDAINAEQRLKVESGNLTIAAGEDAIHCDMELNIGAEGTTGPAITVSTCCEGLEGAVVNIHSGNMDITSTDDCLNAANSDLGDYAFEMNISGGTIKAYSSGGDGFDSNGTLTITGGDISVWTANAADNQRWMPMGASRFRAARCWPQAAARAWAFPSAHLSPTLPSAAGGTAAFPSPGARRSPLRTKAARACWTAPPSATRPSSSIPAQP